MSAKPAVSGAATHGLWAGRDHADHCPIAGHDIALPTLASGQSYRLAVTGTAVAITGNGVPSGSYNIGNLTGAGITLGTLSAGQSANLTYTCNIQ